MPTPLLHDVAILGGGPAGSSAALLLGRACRSVLLCDEGQPANRVAAASYGLLSRDGVSPAQFARLGPEDLHKYPSIRVVEHQATDARRHGTGFRVTLASGESVLARKLVLALGVRYDLPRIPGIDELWGRSVFTCPYCHAYEYRQQPLAILSNGTRAFQLAGQLKSWSSDLLVFTNGPSTLEPHQRLLLEKNAVPVLETRLERLTGAAGQLESIELADGRSVPRRALLVCLRQLRDAGLGKGLGLVADEQMWVHSEGRTAQAGVFVAGDYGNQHPPHFLASALYSGAAVASLVHRELTDEDFQAALF